jgi:hypothetical protein
LGGWAKRGAEKMHSSYLKDIPIGAVLIAGDHDVDFRNFHLPRGRVGRKDDLPLFEKEAR